MSSKKDIFAINKQNTPSPLCFKEFFTKNGGMAYVCVFLTVISAFLSLLLPMVFAFLLDGILKENNEAMHGLFGKFYFKYCANLSFQEQMRFFALLIFAITALQCLLDFIRNHLMGVCAEKSNNRLRIRLFRHMERLPFAWHQKAQTGDLIQRCTSDTRTIKRYFTENFLGIIMCVVLVLSTSIGMLLEDLSMGILALAFTPLLFISALKYFRERSETFEKWDEAEGQLSAELQEAIAGIRVVKAFGREKFEFERLNRCNDEFYELSMNNFRVMADFWMKSDLLCYAQIAAVIIIGAYKVINGKITLGMLLIFIQFTSKLIYPLRQLARQVANTGKMMISCKRLSEILEVKEEPSDHGLAEPKLKGEIEFKNIFFKYPDGVSEVLKDISFKVKSGETLGILGPTGSGKSSLLLLLHKLYAPDAGEILLDGKNIKDISRHTLRRQIGLILQDSFIYSKTIRENIRIAVPDANDATVERYAEIAGLRDDIYEFALAFDTVTGERGITLSGGQRQRLAIARTLIRECPILVLDDSLSAVDTKTDKMIRESSRQRCSGCTTIVVSHRIAALMDCDRVLVLEDGRISQSGKPAELIASEGLFARTYALQTGKELNEAENNGRNGPGKEEP